MKLNLTLGAIALTMLIGCGTDPISQDRADRPDAEPGSAAAAATAGDAGVIDWGSEPPVLFSESLHDLPMPPPGRARVELYGEVLEGELLADCSAPPEVPPQVNDWDDHRLNVSFSVHMDERYTNISVVRRVIPATYDPTPSGPVEAESVAIRTLERGGRSVDLRTYSLRRNRADQPPRVSAAHDQRPQPPDRREDVPGVRIHPDGRRVTFVGLLGRGEEFADSDYEDFEAIRIAIHCGPV